MLFQSCDATDEARKAVDRTPTRCGADPDLELAEDGPLSAGEADVGGQRELAARTAGATPHRADRHGGWEGGSRTSFAKRVRKQAGIHASFRSKTASRANEGHATAI